MAVAKTKETPEVKAEVTEPEAKAEETIKKSDLIETVTQIVKDLLPGKSEETTETEETGTPAKRMTARDEEEHTRGIVATAIQEFLAKSPTDTKETKEVKTEEVPGAKHVRKVEGFMWGKD